MTLSRRNVNTQKQEALREALFTQVTCRLNVLSGDKNGRLTLPSLPLSLSLSLSRLSTHATD